MTLIFLGANEFQMLIMENYVQMLIMLIMENYGQMLNILIMENYV